MKVLWSFFLASILYLLSSVWAYHISAQQEFIVSYNTTYDVHTDGNATVTHNITLTNNFSKLYATSYTLSLERKTPSQISAYAKNGSMPVETKTDGEKVSIVVNFPDAVVGKDKTRNFSIKYNLAKVGIQNGRVWEVTIPKLSESQNINEYELQLIVPASFGEAAYVSPEPRQKTTGDDTRIFTFSKNDLNRAGVVAAFGKFQVFSFALTYHLKNPYSQTGETEIALPPDTAFQQVFYEQISPKPEKIRLDEDGNWLATFKLTPNQNLDVVAEGKVQLFSQPQQLYPRFAKSDLVRQYLLETEYWQVNDPQIKALAKSLKTPRAIYDFVVGRLSYDYSRVREDAKRLGAKQALQNPDSAICMEFTDLFIALARAAGIPAREINGYAYTENPTIQPLSLVADVLHAWPEYWDETLGVWKPVDPTWGNTTGGVDFFDKFDLSHITFAIHGQDPTMPLPAGSYKLQGSAQKDVQVQFSLPPKAVENKVKIEVVSPPILLPFLGNELEVRFTNPGQTAFYNLPTSLESIGFLAPGDTNTQKMKFRPQLFKPVNVVVWAADESLTYNIPTAATRLGLVITIFTSLTFIVAAILFIHFLPNILNFVKWHVLKH